MKSFVFAFLCLYGALTNAQTQAGKISGYLPYENGTKAILLMQLQGNVAGGCNTTGRFAIDVDAPRFKGTQAAVMAAFHTQADVKVIYSQTCNAFGNAWDIVAVCVGNLPC